MPDKKDDFPACSLDQFRRTDVDIVGKPFCEYILTVTMKKSIVALLVVILLARIFLAVSSAAEITDNAAYQKAMLALINRQFPEAVESFATLLTDNPTLADTIALPYAEALLGLADSIRKKDPNQAISLFRRALELDPQSVRAHFQLGLVLTGQKDYAAAIESYQKAIALNPEFPDTFFNLGFIYAVSRDFARAEEMYAQTVALNPDYLDEALFNLALVQSKQNKKEQSLANLNKALAVNPQNQAARDYLKQLQGASAQ